jgi:ATP-binding cassette subfamily C protein
MKTASIGFVEVHGSGSRAAAWKVHRIGACGRPGSVAGPSSHQAMPGLATAAAPPVENGRMGVEDAGRAVLDRVEEVRVIDDLQKCMALLTPGERRRWAALVPVAVITAAMEALAAAAVFGLVAILGDPTRADSLPLLARLGPHSSRPVLGALLLVMALYVVRSACLAAGTWLRHRVVSGSAASLAGRMLLMYLTAPHAFHLRNDSASLIRKTTEAVEHALGAFLASWVVLVTEVCVVGGILVVLLVTAPLVGLVVVPTVVALVLIPLGLTRSLAGRWGREVQTVHEAVLRSLQSSLGAVKEVKLTGRERFFRDVFSTQERQLWRLRQRQSLLADLLRVAVETAFILGLLLVGVVLVLAGSAETPSLPLLGLYAYAGFRVIPSANRVLLHVNGIRFGRAAVRDLYADSQRLAGLPGGAPADGGKLPFTATVAFEGVAYTYDDDRGWALRDVDLVIRRGECLGLVGPSGAGKSTLVDLLLGILEPTRGHLTVDGRDIRLGLRSWQSRIGYVPQTPFLLDDTLRRNIAFGLPDAEIDESRLVTALRAARLDDLVTSLPSGLDTRVGERGVRLSGGERQRVAIARSLYREPEILVLDEATAALDSLSEREVREAIDRLRGHTTLIVIAHRLSTVRGCDRLVYVAEGRITGVGAWDDLLERHPGFRTMVLEGQASPL